jgi:hypothetical protein
MKHTSATTTTTTGTAGTGTLGTGTFRTGTISLAAATTAWMEMKIINKGFPSVQ